MKKRALSMLLSVAMVASVLAGCGGGGSAETASGTAAADTETTESGDGAAAADGSASAASGEPVKLKALFIAHALSKDVSGRFAGPAVQCHG